MALLRWCRRLLGRLWTTSRPDALETDLDAELADHLASAAAYYQARGLSPDAARRAARLTLGGETATREAVRDLRRARWLEDLGRDVRYGLRALRRTPTFTIVALATLTVGIGATAAVFTAVNGTLLRPLPFVDPGRLYALVHAPVRGSFKPGAVLLDTDFVPFRDTQTAFSALAASSSGPTGATLTGVGEPVRLRRMPVTANYFAVLGVRPLLGRMFAPGEGVPGRDHVAVLTSAIWQDRFGADPNVVARVIELDGEPYHVIGVAPVGFDFPHRAEIWTPVDIRLVPERAQFLEVIGRLRPGMTALNAEAAFQAFIRQAPPALGGSPLNPDWVARLTPVNDLVVAAARLPTEIFAGAVAFVLLIACANVANLQLVRTAARRREIAVRAALGAGRGRIVRQLLAENAVIALIGGLFGLGLAAAGAQALRHFAPVSDLPRPDLVRIDGWVVGFTALVSMMAGLGFGLIPALQATRPSDRDALTATARGTSLGGERTRAALAAVEIALALVLLAGGLLLARSFLRLEAVDPGFGVDGRLVASVSLPSPEYGSAGKLQAFDVAVDEQLGALPGVEGHAVINDRPLGHNWTMGDFTLRSGATVPTGWAADKLAVSPGYFQTLAIPVLSGRTFTAADGGAGAPVAIVSASVVRTFWPDGGVLGQQISEAEKPTPPDWVTIVGVVADVTQLDLTLGRRPAVYRPLAQTTRLEWLNHASFILHTAGDPATFGPAVRAAIHRVDAQLPVETLATFPTLVTATTAAPRFQTWLIGLFAAVAVLLAAVGVSGVLAYSVSLRAQEIGIRRALGAGSAEVVGLILRRTLAVAAIGVTAGLGTAWLVSGVLASVLFEIRPHDLTALGGATALLVVVALAASVGPAWRARSVNPLDAIRQP